MFINTDEYSERVAKVDRLFNLGLELSDNTITTLIDLEPSVFEELVAGIIVAQSKTTTEQR